MFVLFKYTDSFNNLDYLKVIVWDIYVPAHNSYMMEINIDYKIENLETNNFSLIVEDALASDSYDVNLILIDGSHDIKRYKVRIGTDIEVN